MKESTPTESREAVALAFYGGDYCVENLKALYERLLDLFGKVGGPPERSSIQGQGFSDNYRSFKANDALLRQRGFDKVTDLSLYRLRPGGKAPLYQWIVAADIATSKPTCIVGVSASLIELPSDALRDSSKSIIEITRATYGIGFRREMRLGPTLYARGIVQNLRAFGEERALAEQINDWRVLGIPNRVYEQGALRDVYPWNFLSNVHLNGRIEDTTLRDWILAHSSRGTLTPVDAMHLWEVPERSIPEVRFALQEANLIFVGRKSRR